MGCRPLSSWQRPTSNRPEAWFQDLHGRRIGGRHRGLRRADRYATVRVGAEIRNAGSSEFCTAAMTRMASPVNRTASTTTSTTATTPARFHFPGPPTTQSTPGESLQATGRSKRKRRGTPYYLSCRHSLTEAITPSTLQSRIRPELARSRRVDADGDDVGAVELLVADG